jgi:membrane protein implicated in regulation of membrane protease activity
MIPPWTTTIFLVLALLIFLFALVISFVLIIDARWFRRQVRQEERLTRLEEKLQRLEEKLQRLEVEVAVVRKEGERPAPSGFAAAQRYP